MFFIFRLVPIVCRLLRDACQKNITFLSKLTLKSYFWLQFSCLLILTISASAAPSISSIVPNSGPTVGGTTITITGSNFENMTEIWGKQTTGSLNQIATGTATDSSGNVYMTGSFDGAIIFDATTTLTSAGLSDIWLAKYSSTGAFIWAVRAGGTGDDIAHGIATDSTGNIYMAGSFSGTATFGALTAVVSAGGTDAFLIKYNASGTEQWLRRGGGTGADAARGVAIDSGGSLFVTGSFSGTATFGALNLTTGGVFVIKYNNSGTEQWAYRSIGNGSGNAIATDTAGNVLVVGSYANTLGVGSTILARGGGGSDGFVFKLSNLGVPIWAKSIASRGADRSAAVVVDAQNNVYVSGSFRNTLTLGAFSLSSIGSDDVFVVGYNSSGTEIWAKKGSGNSDDNGNGLAIDNFSNLYATGQYRSTSVAFGSITLTNNTFTNSFLVKYNLAANVSIDGNNCTSTLLISVTQISCTTPAGTAGPKNVVVQNPDGSIATATGGYTYTGEMAFNIRNSSDTAATNSCDLGRATTSNLASCSYRLKVSSTAADGYSIFIQTSGGLSDGTNSIANAATGTTGSGGHNISASTVGIERYGIFISPGAITGVGTISKTSAFNAGTTNSVNSNYPISQPIIQATGINSPNSTDTAHTTSITHNLNIASDTAAASYTQRVTYTVIPNF